MNDDIADVTTRSRTLWPTTRPSSFICAGESTSRNACTTQVVFACTAVVLFVFANLRIGQRSRYYEPKELPEDQRLIFALTGLEEMSAPEIASALGVKVNTVYSRLRIARRTLAGRLRISETEVAV